MESHSIELLGLYGFEYNESEQGKMWAAVCAGIGIAIKEIKRNKP